MELRKRSRGEGTAQQGHTPLHTFLDLVEGCQHVVVFTGAGISANSGMSTFTSRNGLYDRAREQFNVQDGMKLFTYSFFKQHRAKVQAFFAQIYSEAQSSQAAPGHHALARMLEMGRLQRQYTLNIDGLSEVVGLSTWHPQANPAGSTVELHGNIRSSAAPLVLRRGCASKSCSSSRQPALSIFVRSGSCWPAWAV
ncbi:deacetylase sirtuin-type domain-containing protein, partial [Haematococcus lacustris]